MAAILPHGNAPIVAALWLRRGRIMADTLSTAATLCNHVGWKNSTAISDIQLNLYAWRGIHEAFEQLAVANAQSVRPRP